MTVSNLEKLTALVLHLPQPVDDMDHHFMLAPMQLGTGSASTDTFTRLEGCFNRDSLSSACFGPLRQLRQL